MHATLLDQTLKKNIIYSICIYCVQQNDYAAVLHSIIYFFFNYLKRSIQLSRNQQVIE